MANYFAKSWHPWVFSSLFVLAAWSMGVSWIGVLMLAVLTLIWGLLDYRNRKKLTQGDVLLLGLEQLALVLLSEGKVCANVVIHEGHNSLKIKIISLEENSIETNDSKKYEVLKCSFGMLQSRKLEVGHKIDIASLNLEKVKLFIETENRAEGILVKVDDEIAIEITKVNKNGK